MIFCCVEKEPAAAIARTLPHLGAEWRGQQVYTVADHGQQWLPKVWGVAGQHQAKPGFVHLEVGMAIRGGNLGVEMI